MYWILQDNIFNERAYDALVEQLERLDINTINSCGFYLANIQKLVVDLELAYSNEQYR